MLQDLYDFRFVNTEQGTAFPNDPRMDRKRYLTDGHVFGIFEYLKISNVFVDFIVTNDNAYMPMQTCSFVK